VRDSRQVARRPGGERAELVEHLARVAPRELRAEAELVREQRDDAPVGQGVARRLDGLAEQRDDALAVRHRAGLLWPGGGGSTTGELGGVGGEERPAPPTARAAQRARSRSGSVAAGFVARIQTARTLPSSSPAKIPVALRPGRLGRR
jgi:hypothetical protein